MATIKSFEDFLDRMQGLLDNAKKQGHIIVRIEDIETAFPELKESEDERIRKALIHIVKGACSKYGIKYQGKEIGEEKLLAWLEKHVEQKPQRMVSAEAKETMYDKPAWSEEDAKICGKCIDAASGYYSPEDKQIMKDWLRNLKERVQPQPKQEWSEEDELMRESIIDTLKLTFGAVQMKIDWLKSLKDRCVPQKEYEWSEEDEAIWAEIADLLWEGYKQSGSKFSWDDIRNWVTPKLKSLRPQNTWKPSEEQMDMLAKVCSTLHLTTGENEIMESIYDALKKLK